MLFVGDDWGQDHHDVEVQDESGGRLARARLPEGVVGMARLHRLLGEHLDVDADAGTDRVAVGIETDRGLCVRALVAAGYQVFAVVLSPVFRSIPSVMRCRLDQTAGAVTALTLKALSASALASATHVDRSRSGVAEGARRAGELEPLGRRIWHMAVDAKASIALLLAVTAVEVELKRLVSQRVPGAE